jgi:hypothetical protein
MRAFLASAVLLGCAGSAPASAAPAVDAGLSARLRRVETAFRTGSASTLRSGLTAGKVRVDLRELTDGAGTYGAGQLEVIFTRIFDDNRTREFTFRDEDVTVSGPGTAFARARWVRRARPGGAEATDTLTFTLREEGGDWRIHEIRSSR